MKVVEHAALHERLPKDAKAREEEALEPVLRPWYCADPNSIDKLVAVMRGDEHHFVPSLSERPTFLVKYAVVEGRMYRSEMYYLPIS